MPATGRLEEPRLNIILVLNNPVYRANFASSQILILESQLKIQVHPHSIIKPPKLKTWAENKSKDSERSIIIHCHQLPVWPQTYTRKLLFWTEKTPKADVTGLNTYAAYSMMVNRERKSYWVIFRSSSFSIAHPKKCPRERNLRFIFLNKKKLSNNVDKYLISVYLSPLWHT